ncbi:flagellar export chaperone FliS [Shewanella eurypsychrophilus]|uniref:Flagellar secretion chaperone FliS n=1 Tax=Shewanella eurypsychrophilus TaxID=2593656 RepID=A0ABX6VA32_9GAMM|nr:MULTISPECIES: flagellar export chaperone FliS [Shewanella]QFU23495.1 flagellar export chaperone FliS [Shewanella sp. YLB-09]QPG58721.1 flagellar export chaperone FliS [Shewanella eurypsychrophilus]
MRKSLQSYRKVSLENEISVASPHRVIQMMFEGALQRIAQSRYAIENGDIGNKGIFIGKAIGLITGLNSSLNMDAGGEIAGNLSNLYDFMLRRISEANINNDIQALDDVSDILKIIKEGWDAIPEEDHHTVSHTEAV